MARRICETAKVSTAGATRARSAANEADALYQAIQRRRSAPRPPTASSPIGEELILKGLHQVVPGEFYAAATRPPAVYRGNPFQIEVGLAYGGATAGAEGLARSAASNCSSESDARTLRQFLINTFDGLGSDAADKILKEAEVRHAHVARQAEARRDRDSCTQAMRNVNSHEGQTMKVLRYANRVPLQFQAGACAITQTVIGTNWRSYGLSQSRGSLPSGPVTLMVHMASVWVPFTSESKEAVAGYPEIQKELRLGLQAVGRKLGMYLRRRQQVKQEGERRNIFLRYLGEVATAVSDINEADRDELYEQLLEVAKKKTAEADVQVRRPRPPRRRG